MTRALVSLALFFSAAAYGQSAVQRFEVASVKPTPLDQRDGESGGRTIKGRLTMHNVTLKRCIMGAWAIGPSQIQGGPDWLDSDRFEIVAKADQPVGDRELMAMLQTLLAERFKLAIHRETKPVQAFALEVAKSGPKLEKSAEGEPSTTSGRGRIDAKSIAMPKFAEVLGRHMEAPVINLTGLEGAYTFSLQWNPESDKPARPGADAAAADPGLSIFTAIQQQLGLRLRPQKTAVEIVVIDHVEKPSEN